MRVVSFDPGHTTGVAVFDEDGAWVMGLTVGSPVLGDRLFQGIVKMARPDAIIVESPPQFSRDPQTDSNYHAIKEWFLRAGFTVYEVNPGQWKGMVAPEKISGQHQIDAATMGNWWLRSTEGVHVQKGP